MAAVAAVGSALMLVGAWGTWVKIGIFNISESVGGLHGGVDGRYVLALGLAALLTAGSAITTGQTNLQVRQICAGVLIVLGVIGLIIVVHSWVTISDQVERVNAFTQSFTDQYGQLGDGAATRNPLLASFDGIHVSRGWGLWLSGIASSITGLAGVYLALAKRPWSPVRHDGPGAVARVTGVLGPAERGGDAHEHQHREDDESGHD
jgi:hypothetical protein